MKGRVPTSWWGHARELRRRLLWSLGATAVAAVVMFALWDVIIAWMRTPYCSMLADLGGQSELVRDRCTFFVSNPIELFTTRLSASLWLGVLAVAPVYLWHLCRFVLPGLNPRERRWFWVTFVVSVILFVCGSFIGWLTFPKALSFFFQAGGGEITTLLHPGGYLRLVAGLLIGFGVAFELPLVLIGLQLGGIVSGASLRSARRYAIVGLVAAAAVLTPSGDPYSLFLMAIPLYLLYEAAAQAGRVIRR